MKLILKLSNYKILTTAEVEPKTITENGTYTPSSGFVGLNPVTVNVQPELEDRTLTANGEYTPSEGKYGISTVTVAVPAPTLLNRTITQNGVFTAAFEPSEPYGYGQVTVDVPNMVGEAEADIVFYDFNGDILKTFLFSDLPLSESDLPEPPSHMFLQFTGWTHTLEEINTCGHILNVGAEYTPFLKTYSFLTVSPATGLAITLAFSTSDATTVVRFEAMRESDMSTVVWSWEQSGTGNFNISAYFPDYDKYILTSRIVSGDGTYALGDGTGSFIGGANQVMSNSLTKVYIYGADTTLPLNSFKQCSSLEEVVIDSNNITALAATFSSCYSLKSCVIPKNVTKTASNWATSASFSACSNMRSIVIPNSILIFGSGEFSGCSALRRLILSENLPVASGSLIANGNSLRRFYIKNNTRLSGSSFLNCNALEEIVVTEETTSIPIDFAENCYSASKLTCYSTNITSISNGSMVNMRNMKVLDFTALTAVPTLISAGAFSGLNTLAIFKFKSSLLNAFKTATNWSVYANQMVGVEV